MKEVEIQKETVKAIHAKREEEEEGEEGRMMSHKEEGIVCDWRLRHFLRLWRKGSLLTRTPSI